MPAVLKEAIINAYKAKGWDLECSRGNEYPTFEDVSKQIDIVMNSSDYSDENKGNYKGALKTRINSLCNGLNKTIFCDDRIIDASLSHLFENNVIVDLSRIGANDTKALMECKCGVKEYLQSQLKNHIPNQLSGHIGKSVLLVTNDVLETESGLVESVCDRYDTTLNMLNISASDIDTAMKGMKI